MGSYSWVHWERTRRRVILDLPQPPSPQIVMVIFWGASEDILRWFGRPGVVVIGSSARESVEVDVDVDVDVLPYQADILPV